MVGAIQAFRRGIRILATDIGPRDQRDAGAATRDAGRDHRPAPDRFTTNTMERIRSGGNRYGADNNE